MSAHAAEAADLLDLRLLPAWVKEPAEPKRYEDHTGEEENDPLRSRRPGKPKRSGFNKANPRKHGKPGRGFADGRERRNRPRGGRHGGGNRQRKDRHPPVARPLPDIAVRFLPYPPAFENVKAQIQSGSVAYSLFALARLFLERPERYEVHLAAKSESPLFRLGDNGAFSPDREFLERNAFRFAHESFYKIDITQSEPIKGDFSNVARCRLSGILLGPTNHHAYQPKLRSLYEQRFSRRMSFADYQRQIEIVSDPALVDRWKAEARTVTTYTTLGEASPAAFSSATEAERHFRAHYFPGLIRTVEEITIGGVMSRQLSDRTLNRLIEDAWTRETRSPSNAMQELAGRFRHAGLNVFRHRRGMLFVSPVRPRPFTHDQTGVSPAVNAILEAIGAAPAINGRDLFATLVSKNAADDAEPRKLGIASDLRWLISEGYVIEFNDGSLDLPRVKPKPQAAVAGVHSSLGLPCLPIAEPTGQSVAASVSNEPSELEIGGS